VRLYSAGASDEFDMQIFNAGDYMKAVEQKMLSETISKGAVPFRRGGGGPRTQAAAGIFFVACAVHDIVQGFVARGEDFTDFSSQVAIQLNDTHPH